MMRAISPQDYLRKENATIALIKLLTDLNIIGSRIKPFRKHQTHVSMNEVHAFIHRQVKFQL